MLCTELDTQKSGSYRAPAHSPTLNVVGCKADTVITNFINSRNNYAGVARYSLT